MLISLDVSDLALIFLLVLAKCREEIIHTTTTMDTTITAMAMTLITLSTGTTIMVTQTKMDMDTTLAKC